MKYLIICALIVAAVAAIFANPLLAEQEDGFLDPQIHFTRGMYQQELLAYTLST